MKFSEFIKTLFGQSREEKILKEMTKEEIIRKKTNVASINSAKDQLLEAKKKFNARSNKILNAQRLQMESKSDA